MSISIQPTVLLQVADHFHKVADGTRNRVVGVLMGEIKKQGDSEDLTVTNSFPVPFEEDRTDKSVWYFDRIYADEMYKMIHKVNSLETVVGFYSTAREVVACDKNIADVILTLGCKSPVLILADVNANDSSSLTTCYRYDPISTTRHWTHIPHKMAPLEIEKVAISYLARQSKMVENYSGTLTEGEMALRQSADSKKEMLKCLQLTRDYVAGLGDKLSVYDEKILDQVSDMCESWASINSDRSSLSKELVHPALQTLYGCIERCILSVDALATNRETGK